MFPGLTQGEFLTVIFNLLTAGLIVWQIRVAVVSIQADHERRRLESTMSHMAQVQDKYRGLIARCENELEIDIQELAPITLSQLEKLDSNPSLKRDLKDLLGLLEHLAVGANAGVFDLQMLNRMSGMVLCGIFVRYKPYMLRARAIGRNRLVYSEFEDLIRKVHGLRQQQGMPTSDQLDKWKCETNAVPTC